MDVKNVQCAPQRRAVAAEVLEFACRLADQAQYLTDQVYEKLSPVMASDCPRQSIVESKKEAPEYPPLFEALRDKFYTIQHALESIAHALERTEL